MRRWLLYIFLFSFLVSCGGSGSRAPIEERRAKPQTPPASYSVKGGDTLFSIAWRYGLDYRKVAANNHISPPYTIYPGQKVYLAQRAPPKTEKKPSSSAAASGASSGARTVKSNSATSKPAAPPATKSKTTATPAKSGACGRGPTPGRVTRGYSSTVHKGIDIDGKRGDSITAVAAGTVVYAGSGIVGYGELLIVKHNEVYLSAYGHNSRLLVAEGAQVRAGQKIAEKGSSGTDTVKLHFEIRKEGKPIDPKRLLPPR